MRNLETLQLERVFHEGKGKKIVKEKSQIHPKIVRASTTRNISESIKRIRMLKHILSGKDPFRRNLKMRKKKRNKIW